MSRGGPGIHRRFHFKSALLKDLAIQRFGEWSNENRGFYMGFRDWLKENGYGPSTLNIYGAATRMAIGFLHKPYWMIDPQADLERVQEHLARSYRAFSTQTDYRKGLKKFAEYLRLRCHRLPKEKPLPWQYTVASLSLELQGDVREFLKHCQRAWKVEQRWERSRNNLYALGIPLRWMAEHAHLREIGELTPQVWETYLDYRIRAGMKAETVNSDLSILKHFIYFLRETGRPVCERFLLLQPLQIGFRLPKDVPLERLRKLQAVILAEANSPHAGHRRMGRMDLAWFLLMLHGGLRTCEIRNLKLADVEWETKRLRIEQSKGLKDRQIYLDQAVLGALQAYLAVRGQAEALPPNVFIFRHAPLSYSYCFERLRTYGLRCGVRASPHQLRHSCATLLLNAGAPVLSVQMILGHKQIDTTLGYARLYDGTLAADYYSAMNRIEQQLALPEDRRKGSPSLGQLIALADALRNGLLNPAQTEIVRALREGLGLLEQEAMESVKVQMEVDLAQAFAC
jgi:site-specific recombinase XerD